MNKYWVACLEHGIRRLPKALGRGILRFLTSERFRNRSNNFLARNVSDMKTLDRGRREAPEHDYGTSTRIRTFHTSLAHSADS
jgi:hypothetical protein